MPEMHEQLQAALGPSYVLERELGRGGMATVFLAQDAKHGRPVALKVLHQDLAASLGPERFRREITLAAKLQHPHILTVLDSGETATGQLWFTMPFVEGESLRDRLVRERQLPLEDALRITHEVALALEYAHRHGVIHRDVKPENILLTTDGQALVADFGVARALTPGTAGGTLTDTGMAVGTPQYMSPEQASAERTLTSRTDVYSLGAVLYEMLAGEPPFTGPTAQAVVAKMMVGEPPSVRRVRPAVSATVDAAIQKALAPVSADRFPTALEFARALDTAAATTAAPGAAPAPPPPSPVAVRRRIPVGAALLVLGFVLGGGALFAWRHHMGGSIGSADVGAATLAVLPFENEGDSADAYFADGMTDAVRGKLTSVPGLEVTAPASSGQYRHTTKTPQQIGQELGVRYLLVGKIRWAKAAGSASRVEVSPALIDATSGSDKWEQPFDAPLTDVFQVQADIAGKVAEQLRVRLGTQDRQTLAAQPTQNLDAYDAYLRGEAIAQTGNSPAILRSAIAAYADAVRRDSTFALAWAELATVQSLLYANGAPTTADADAAQHAAERALALAPNLPEAHAAMGAYYAFVRSDYRRALTEDSLGLARAPNNAVLLNRMASTERSLGRWDAAVGHYELAQRLNPQSANVAFNLAFAELYLRRYAAATAATSRALALEPSGFLYVEERALVALAQGDLAGARAVMHAMPPPVDTAALVAYLGTYYDLGWVLDSAQERVLLRLRPDAFDDSRGTWGIVLAQQYALRGDMAHARVYADSARLGFDAELKATPDDAQRHAFRGLALAYRGRKEEAVREAERALALAPIASDAFDSPYVQHQAARVYLVVGDTAKALDLLEPLLRIPYYLSPAWLRIDPNFAPLRANPRFERLLAAGS